jgi:hypothetical protein
MRIRFLLDENLSPRIKAAVLRHDPAIDILRVGDETAPSLATSDPDILIYLESAQRLLVSDNDPPFPHIWPCISRKAVITGGSSGCVVLRTSD